MFRNRTLRWCAEALAVTGNNVDEALTWILTNGERLSEEDEEMDADGGGGDGDEDDDEDSADDDEEEEEEEATEQADASAAPKVLSGVDGQQAESKDECVAETDSSNAPSINASRWRGSIIPLRFISGRAAINPDTMEVSGLPTGGFSSVGCR